MPTIAELQIEVNSKPLSEATTSLNNFADAADKASRAAKNKTQVDKSLSDSSKAVADNADASAKATDRQNKEFEKLVNKIDPVAKKLNELAKQEALLFSNKNKLPSSTFDEYNKKIQESFDKLLNVGKAQTSVMASTDGIPQRLMDIANAAIKNAEAHQTLTTAAKGASEAEQGLVNSDAVSAANRRASAALEEHNEKVKLAQSTRDVSVSQKQQTESLSEFLGKIDPAIRKLDELDQMQRRLDRERKAGVIDTETYERFTQVIDRNRASLQRYSDGLQNSGKSAKELAFAMRGLPAQFTDIVVSLQGGQAPLTVLLQQGGQIKDMFGGIAPALRAVGTGLLSMINPITVVGAAIAATAVATYSGSEELTAFNRAVIASGNASGISASQYAALRNSLDNTTTTAGKASEALTLIASSGKVAGDQFEAVAETALLMEKATGQAISKTVEDFAAIGKDPVQAAIRLDDQYKFLTASVLAQADALVQQGKESEAVVLLQTQLASAASDTANTMIEQAGYIERAWSAVKGTIKEAWDELKNIGRDSTAGEQLAKLQARQAEISRLARGNEAALARNNEYQENAAEVRRLTAVATQEKDIAEQRAQQEKARSEAVSATASALKRSETGLKGVEKAEKDLQKVRLENQKARGNGDISADLEATLVKNEQRAVEELAKAKEKAGKVKTTPVDNTAVQDVKNNLSEITAQYDGYYKKIEAVGKANVVSAEATYYSLKAVLEGEAKAVADSYDKQIAEIEKLQGRKGNNAAQNISLNNQLSKAESQRAVELEKIETKLATLQTAENARLEERKRNIASYKAALDSQLEGLVDEGARNADGVGRGSRQADIARRLAENDRTFSKQQAQLSKSLGEGMDPEEYAEKLDALRVTHTKMSEQIIANDRDIQNANRDWTNGFTAAVENAQDAGLNFAGTVNQAMTGAFNSAGDALATFVTTGKLNFKEFTASILSDMARIASQQAASSVLSSLFGAVASGISGGATNGFAAGTAAAQSSAAGASQAGYSGLSGWKLAQAQGGAWSGGTQMFAQGGAFTNSIVSSPTAFGMANGAKGVMGEAGDEAIVPLARTRNGDLGVRTIGGSSAGGTIVNVNVQVTQSGTSSSTDGGAQWKGFGNEMASFVETKVYTIINKETRPGGSLQAQ